MTRQKKSIFIKSAIWNFQVKIHKDSERCFSSCHECRIKKKLSTVMLSTILVLAVCGTRVIDFVIDLAHRRVSVAQYRALKVWFSIPHRDSEVFLCYTLVTRRKTSFSIFFTEIKTYHLSFYLSYIKLLVIRTNQRAACSHIYMQCLSYNTENIQESLHSFSLVNIYNKKSNYRLLITWNLRIHWTLFPNIDNGCLSCINEEIIKLVI